MVQHYEDPFDRVLLGGGGIPYWGFGKKPVIGQYIEGFVEEKRSRHSTKYQTQQQRDAGFAVEYEYFVGKSKVTSPLPEEQFRAQNPQARPIIELILVLRTSLRDPQKNEDDGLRQFVFPRDAKDKLAAEVRRQGMTGGLPVGSFVRVTLTELQPVEGLDTPKRIYRVELWGPGEQPSPSPAQPVVQQAPAVAQQPVYQQFPGGGGGAAQQFPVLGQFDQGGVVQGGTPVAGAQPQANQLNPDLIRVMIENGMPLTPEVRQAAVNMGLIAAE